MKLSKCPQCAHILPKHHRQCSAELNFSEKKLYDQRQIRNRGIAEKLKDPKYISQRITRNNIIDKKK